LGDGVASRLRDCDLLRDAAIFAKWNSIRFFSRGVKNLGAAEEDRELEGVLGGFKVECCDVLAGFERSWGLP
jgi:hypothetical protein